MDGGHGSMNRRKISILLVALSAGIIVLAFGVCSSGCTVKYSQSLDLKPKPPAETNAVPASP